MILHVIKSNIYSGAENVACQIITSLEDTEDCIYLAPHGPIEDKLKALGLYHCYRGIDKLDIQTIKNVVSEIKPDIIHAHDFTASVICAFAVKNTIPIVSHLHNNPPWIQNINYKTLSYLYASRYFKQIIVVSENVKKEFRYTRSISCPITVIGNPFSVSNVRTRAGDAEASDILFVGRLTEQKDPIRVLQLANELHKKYNFTLRILGDGELYNDCQQYITDNQMQDYAILEGFKENAYSYMSNAKILLMPSKWEGFGLVALECMAFGIPVVCSGAGGLSQIINDSCGYKCQSDNDYLDALSQLLSDRTIYESKSDGAKNRSAEYDTISQYISTLKKVYSAAIQSVYFKH